MDTEIRETPEELAAEQAALQTQKEDEVRKTVIAEYGFDETADAEKITKMVERELEHSKKLSQAIGQKVKYRDLAKQGKDTQPQKPAEEKKDKKADLSTEDVYALVNAKVPQEDIGEITKAAKLLEKPISEALKDPIVQSILSKKAEERATANATTTGTARRATTHQSDDEVAQDLLQNSKIPEKGSPEAEAAFWARRGGKRK